MQKQANKAATTKADATTKAATDAKAAKPETAKPTQADTSAKRAAERAATAKRISAERDTASKLFAKLDAASVSIPVKSLAAFGKSYNAAVTAHPIGRKPSVRQAAAIAAAVLSDGKAVSDGVTVSRKFKRGDASFAIENGALSDAIASGLVRYNGKAETITVAKAAEIKSLLGAKANVKL